jgi:hypothetical protein
MKCIFLFASIHQVMRAEKLLKGRGMEVNLIPVPREISSDCGVAIELPGNFREETLGLLEEHHFPVMGCYTRTPEGDWVRGDKMKNF